MAFSLSPHVRARSVVAVSALVIAALVSVTMNSPSAHAAIGDRTLSNCTMVGETWGKVCFKSAVHYGTSPSGVLYYRHTDVTVTYGDTAAHNGHYVMLQRDASWDGSGFQTVSSTGDPLVAVNLLFRFGCSSSVRLRLKESGTGLTTTPITVRQGPSGFCQYVDPSTYIS